MRDASPNIVTAAPNTPQPITTPCASGEYLVLPGWTHLDDPKRCPPTSLADSTWRKTKRGIWERRKAYNGIEWHTDIFDFSQSSSTGLKPVRGPASPSEISRSKSWVFSACIVMRCVFQSLSQLLAFAPSISINATDQF